MEILSFFHLNNLRNNLKIRISYAHVSIMLILGSAIDIWKREIHDYYWIVFGSVGFLLIFTSLDIISDLVSMGIALIIAPFVILVWRIGLFGGADAFALIALAVIAPMATFTELQFHLLPRYPMQQFFL
jgi:hypothetical protein